MGSSLSNRVYNLKFFLLRHLGYTFKIGLLCMLCNVLVAGVPNWSVNQSSYVYSMNVTAKLNIDCVDLSDTLNMVGAFVNGVCRGKARSSSLINGDHLAFLTVYSNTFSGDTIVFKLYDAGLDSVFEISGRMVFLDGAAIGHPASPYLLYTDAPPTDIDLSKLSVIETQADSLVGLFSTVDADSPNHAYTLVAGVGDTDNVSFLIKDDSLFTNTTLDFDLKKSYSIRVETRAGDCSYEKAFTIVVKDSNHAPTNVVLDVDSIDENNSLLQVVGNLASEDNDAVDIHTYRLVAGVGGQDNGSFVIYGTQLKLNTVGDFESQSTYSILLETDDGDSGTFTKVMTISINDVNEEPVVEDTTFTISENLAIGSVVGVLNIFDQDANETQSINLPPSVPFQMNGNSIEQKVPLDFEAQSSYTFTIEVFDKSGLSDQATVNIMVRNEIEPRISLPVNEVISPNSDGINDWFVIEDVSLYSNYSLRIFNRSGFVIFEVPSNYDNSWGATYNGNLLDSGVYYYLFQNNANPDQYFKGSINIIR